MWRSGWTGGGLCAILSAYLRISRKIGFSTGSSGPREDGFSGDHEIWAVFDRDDHPHIPELRRRAAENGVRVAFSEPCFEVWALLHRPDGLGPMTSREAIERVCTDLPSYRREKRLDYDALRPHHDVAIARAERLRAERERDGATNPYTDLDVLLRLVRDNGTP